MFVSFFFFQAEDGIRDGHVTGVQTCALPISSRGERNLRAVIAAPAESRPGPARQIGRCWPARVSQRSSRTRATTRPEECGRTHPESYRRPAGNIPTVG